LHFISRAHVLLPGAVIFHKLQHLVPFVGYPGAVCILHCFGCRRRVVETVGITWRWRSGGEWRRSHSTLPLFWYVWLWAHLPLHVLVRCLQLAQLNIIVCSVLSLEFTKAWGLESKEWHFAHTNLEGHIEPETDWWLC